MNGKNCFCAAFGDYLGKLTLGTEQAGTAPQICIPPEAEQYPRQWNRLLIALSMCLEQVPWTWEELEKMFCREAEPKPGEDTARQFYEKLQFYREVFPILRDGRMTLLHPAGESLLIYRRDLDRAHLLVICNGGPEQVRFLSPVGRPRMGNYPRGDINVLRPFEVKLLYCSNG